ncbi:MAG: pyridoxal-phosphate dependent enzyme, partial [Thermoplasmatota archaeon]
GLAFVHAFNDQQVVAGQGTIGMEIFEELPEAEVVLVPVGGGGLISGIALALKHLSPEVQVIGVEAEGAQSMVRSLEKGEIVPQESISTIADGIAVKHPGELTFGLVKRYVDEVVTVTDEEIARTLYLLLQRAKLVVEPAGAVGLAALLCGRLSFPGRRVVSVISGGNINLSLLSQVIERGMMQHHLLARVAIVAPDRPDVLDDIISILAGLRANVLSISHDRLTTSVPIGQVKITITFQTLDEKQIDAIREELEERGLEFDMLR